MTSTSSSLMGGGGDRWGQGQQGRERYPYDQYERYPPGSSGYDRYPVGGGGSGGSGGYYGSSSGYYPGGGSNTWSGSNSGYYPGGSSGSGGWGNYNSRPYPSGNQGKEISRLPGDRTNYFQQTESSPRPLDNDRRFDTDRRHDNGGISTGGTGVLPQTTLTLHKYEKEPPIPMGLLHKQKEKGGSGGGGSDVVEKGQ